MLIVLMLCLLLFLLVGCGSGGQSKPAQPNNDGSHQVQSDAPDNSDLPAPPAWDDSSEEEDDDSDTSTEEKLQPVSLDTSGIYAFYSPDFNCYLACSGNTLVLSTEPHFWELMPSGSGCYVYSQGTDLLLDIDNAYVAQGTVIKTWQNTGYPTQVWSIAGNADGTYSILCSTDPSFALSMDSQGASLQKTGSGGQRWQAIECTEQFFTRVNGARGIVELRLPLDITDVISLARLQQWANDLETAYDVFADLTGYIPYDTIIVEGYKPCQYMAYVTDDCNVIRMDNTFIREDLAKMAVRDNDWNFGALHEMGHMFDNHRPWTFEAEMMTDLKVAYVLEATGACATPSEFDASYNFRGADIINAYEAFGTDFSREYHIYAVAWKFLTIKEDIGWEPFRQTFHEMQANYDLYSNATPRQMLDNFIGLLSQYSGRDVQSYFSAAEWNTLTGKVSS